MDSLFDFDKKWEHCTGMEEQKKQFPRTVGGPCETAECKRNEGKDGTRKRREKKRPFFSLLSG
jgi:hypothetical protein